MVTRSQSSIVKPLEHFSLHAASIFPIPKTPFVALQNSHWRQAMLDNYNALIKNGTWILVPKPAGVNMVRSMLLFKHKFHANGTLSRYKARLVGNGSSQHQCIDVDDTFSPVVKPATIRTVLSLAVSRKWPIHQLDVKNAFLNDNLSETVYMHQPPGFTDPQHLNHVCLLQRSLYGLRQAPRLFLSQKKYACELLELANMVNCNPLKTPVDTDSKLGPEFVSTCMSHRSLTLLPLNVSCGRSEVLWTSFLSFMLPRPPPSLGDNLLSWSSKRQHTISRSSSEAKYRGVANVVAETAWLRNLLRELHFPLCIACLVYCDNVSAVYLSANPVQHQRTKHIEIDIHFICDMVQTGHIRVLHVPSRYQYADIFTKGLPTALFEDFRSSLSVRLPSAQTTGAY
nr:ribonuclease H-like domain-containing protein [Tanacetum cinerariifolium]